MSLGTNDLSQYTMAADREVGDLALLNDPWQPAVLRMMRLAFEAGAAAGKPVSVCGEAAADPMLAAVLVGFGASSLSMSPRALGHVGELLAGVTLDDCREAAADAVPHAPPRVHGPLRLALFVSVAERPGVTKPLAEDRAAQPHVDVLAPH